VADETKPIFGKSPYQAIIAGDDDKLREFILTTREGFLLDFLFLKLEDMVWRQTAFGVHPLDA